MKIKYLIGICLMVLFLMSVAGVSASDDVNKTVESEILSAGASADVVGVSIDENLISSNNRDWYVNASASDGGDGSNSTPYNNFKSVLDNSNLRDGDSVYFAGGEIYVGDGKNVNLAISKQLNLLKYGSGEAVFDAENKSGIFKVNAIYFNITGLTFQNGNSEYGGALYFLNGIYNSTINATFINNTATSFGGGANSFYSVSNSNITGTYINNTATEGNGGANYFNGDVSNSNINGKYVLNAANASGGANYFNGEVSNSNITGTYINNTATRFNGGANYFVYKVSYSNITGTYINNIAKGYGGANFFFQEVLNSNISGMYNRNKAIKSDGGAIYFNMGGIIFGGTFVNNSADNAVGGAVYFSSEGASSVYDSIFINNSAGNFSAVHLSSNDGIVSGCVFINNSADFGVVGQAWDTSSNMNVNNNIFLNNDVKMNVIDFADGGDVNADYNWFGNNASNYDALLEVANVEINNWLFLNATADPSSISVFDTSDILFILYSTNGTHIHDYDNSKLPTVNLTLTATRGDVSNSTALNKSVEYMATKVGQGSVTASIEDAECTIFLENMKANPELSAKVDPQEADYGFNTTIILEYNVNATGTVNITLTGYEYNYSFEDVSLNNSITLPEMILPDNYNITVSYGGDETFVNATANATLIVNKLKLELSVEDSVIDYGETIMIILRYNDNATGLTNIYFRGEKYGGDAWYEPLNNTIIIEFSLLPDVYNVTVEYFGNQIFESATANATLIINKLDSELSVEAPTIAYGEDIILYLNYNENATGTADIAIAGPGGHIFALNQTLNRTIVFDDVLKPGDYVVSVYYHGDDIFNESNIMDVNLTINKLDSELSVEAPTIAYGEDIILYLNYNENATGTADIAIAGPGGHIFALNQTLNRTFTFGDVLKPGDYVVSLYYHGDEIFNETNIMDVNLTINKVDITPEIILNDTIMTVNLSNDASGNVTLTLGNNTLVSPINNGIAEFDLSEIPDGDYNATLTYSGDDIYDGFEEIVPVSIKQDFNMIAENLTKYYGGSEAFLVEVINLKGQPLSGKTVQITINGVTYNRITNESGIAKLNINLNAGEYPASVSLENKTVNTTVRVLTTVNGTDITKVCGDGTTYDATFLDSEGNYLEDGTEVRFNINGVFYNANVSGNSGLAELNIDLPAGEYIVTAINPVTGENEANNITMIKADSKISVETHDISYSEWDGIIADIILPGDATGNVSITIGNDTVVYDINSSEHRIIGDKTILFIRNAGLDVGEHNISATYEGNEYYNASDDNGIFNVLKADYNITINAFDIDATDVNAVVAVIRLPGDARGNVSVSINDDDFTIEINATTVRGINGALLMPVYNNAYPAGDYIISATYGSDSYKQSTANDTFTISKASCPSNITVNDTIVSVEVPEDATGNITLSIGNKTFVAPIENGTAAFDLSDVPSGDYNVTVSYGGDDIYDGFEFVYPISVEDKFIIIAEDLTKYYSGSEGFTVNLTDRKGNPIANASIVINLNGVNYTRITDEKGIASMAINLNSGEYPVVVSYNGTSVNATVTVLFTVNGTDVVKVFKNATQYYATFLDSEGKYLEDGATVKFNIHGVMYERKISGNEGLARLNINLEQGEYIITAMNPVTGENAANNITVIPRLIENRDIIKYYRNATQYTVKVIGDDGNPVGANVTVRFNIHGVFYERQTNESGIVKLNINLEPGDYIITAEYAGCRVSNDITVLPVLSADNLIKKYGTPDQFVVTLVDGQGNPFADQKIQFNIHGVFYYRTTDSSGHAKLNINLMPGEYIITSSYDKANLSNKITVKI